MWYTLFFIYRFFFHFWFVTLPIKLVHGCNMINYKTIFVDFTSTSTISPLQLPPSRERERGNIDWQKQKLVHTSTVTSSAQSFNCKSCQSEPKQNVSWECVALVVVNEGLNLQMIWILYNRSIILVSGWNVKICAPVVFLNLIAVDEWVFVFSHAITCDMRGGEHYMISQLMPI